MASSMLTGRSSPLVLNQLVMDLVHECFLNSAVDHSSAMSASADEANLRAVLCALRDDVNILLMAGQQASRLLEAIRELDEAGSHDTWVTWPGFVARVEVAANARYVDGFGLVPPQEQDALSWNRRGTAAVERAQTSNDLAFDKYAKLLASSLPQDLAPQRDAQMELDTQEDERQTRERMRKMEDEKLEAKLRSREQEVRELEDQLKALQVAAEAEAEATPRVPVPCRTSIRLKSGEELFEMLERRMAVADPATEKVANLTEDQESVVHHALHGGPANEMLVTLHNAELTRAKMRCLLPATWLNDEVINLYIKLIADRDVRRVAADPSHKPSYLPNSFFLSKLLEKGTYNYAGVKRWTRKAKVDVFACSKVILPVNVNNMHWCLAVVWVQEKRIQYYDSMGGSGMTYLKALLRWLGDEMKDKKSQSFDETGWELVPSQPGTPQQANGCDCG
ncbi:unnamed protein product, partial [Chrysoparadoxa australica]